MKTLVICSNHRNDLFSKRSTPQQPLTAETTLPISYETNDGRGKHKPYLS